MKKLLFLIFLISFAIQGFSQSTHPNEIKVYQGAKHSSFIFGTKQLDIYGDATHCWFDFTGNRPFYFLDSVFVNGQRVLTLNDTNYYATSSHSGFLKYSDWISFNAKYGSSDTTSTVATKSDIIYPIRITLNGNGNVIQTGHYGGYVQAPFTGHITEWNMSEGSDVPISTTTVINVWKKSTFYPVVSDSLIWTKPALTAATNNSATGLNIAVTKGDWIAVNVNYNSTAKILNFKMLLIKK